MSILRTLLLVAILAVVLAGMPSTATPHTASAAMTLSSSSSVPDTGDRVSGSAVNNAGYANEVLADLAATYRYLDGVTVSLGATPNGEQAVAFYTEGQIVISPSHTTSIDAILAHEIWHIIDWRDDGQLDWGESLPPSNPHAYLKR